MNQTPSPEPSSRLAATCNDSARLANAARADQRDQTMLLDERRDFGDLRFAADEAGELQRQVVREDVERAQRWKVGDEIGREQLVDVLGASEVAQPVLAQIAQARLRRQVALHEIGGDTRYQHLAAVSDREQTRDAIDAPGRSNRRRARRPCRYGWPHVRAIHRRLKNLLQRVRAEHRGSPQRHLPGARTPRRTHRRSF